MGRRALVPWEALYPGLAAAQGATSLGALDAASIDPVPAVRVPRLTLVPSGGREGPHGIHGQRPGRDTKGVSLGSSFGAGA
jgi:hypothetical protein